VRFCSKIGFEKCILGSSEDLATQLEQRCGNKMTYGLGLVGKHGILILHRHEEAGERLRLLLELIQLDQRK